MTVTMPSKPIFLAILLATVFTCGFRSTEAQNPIINPMPEPDPNFLRVYALPVGQGDCTIIQCPGTPNQDEGGEIIIVDAGSSGGNGFSVEDVKTFLGLNNLNRQQRNINIFITHADADHYNYLFQIWPVIYGKYRRVETVVIGNKKNYENNAIRNWIQYWHSLNKLSIIGGDGCIGVNHCPQIAKPLCSRGADIKFLILAANNQGRNLNPSSIVMKVVMPNSQSILLPGDMEGKTANKIAGQLQGTLQSTVYKISHHGASCEANSYLWLRYIAPKMAFVSSQFAANGYRHPRCDAIARLEYIRTLQQDQNQNGHHPLSCGTNYKDQLNYIFKPNYPYNVYQTTPKPDQICVLKYAFTVPINFANVRMDMDCYQWPHAPGITVSNITEEEVEEESCNAINGDCEIYTIKDTQ